MLSRRILALSAVVLSLVMAEPASAQFGGLFGSKPKIPTITAEQLRQLQLQEAAAAGTKPSSFVLVDTRSPAEYAISMIPGAIFMQTYEQNSQHYQGRTVIAYCTTGYRSGQFARKVVGSGGRAFNFEGSILAWCNARFPLVAPDGKPTNRVHTYDASHQVPGEYQAVY